MADKKKMLMGFVTVFIMISGGLGLFASNLGTSSDMEYNGYEFTQTQSGWYFTYNGEEFMMNFHPLNLEHIEVSSTVLQSNVIALSHDPDSPMALEIARVRSSLSQHLGRLGYTIKEGFTKETDSSVPKINCESNETVIVFEQGENDTFSSPCLVLRGNSGSDLQMKADRLVYESMGVINE